jgi:hypothetical protein
MKATVPFASLVLVCSVACYADGASVEDVVRRPGDYAGKSVDFQGVTLSGTITKYDVSGIRKYYLTVQTADRVYEAGFFLAPPRLADRLYETLSPRKNYAVNLTCKVEKISVNGFEQWHGIVTAIAFLDGDGKVIETIKADAK